jgi:hypothetical protein
MYHGSGTGVRSTNSTNEARLGKLNKRIPLLWNRPFVNREPMTTGRNPNVTQLLMRKRGVIVPELSTARRADAKVGGRDSKISKSANWAQIVHSLQVL